MPVALAAPSTGAAGRPAAALRWMAPVSVTLPGAIPRPCPRSSSTSVSQECSASYMASR